MKLHWKSWRVRRLVILGGGVLLLGLAYLAGWMFFMSWIGNPAPVISFGSELVEVSVEDGPETLLQGVTAIDAKDGDVTDSIMIESMSPMMDDDTRIVTYAAFDGDNQVCKGQRKIRYTDYTPTRFSLEQPMGGSYAEWDITTLLEPLRATDCFDGDLTRQIVVTNWNWELSADEYRILLIDVQVANSAGVMTEATLPIILTMEDGYHQNRNAQIELKEYLCYHSAGEPFDPMAYVERATIGDEEQYTGQIWVETDIDVHTPGVYLVTYGFAEQDEARNMKYEAYCDMLVIVE